MSVCKLEQEILDCWNVTKDLDNVYVAICDRPIALTEDELANLLLGIKQLYKLKFEQMFSTFEQVLKDEKLKRYKRLPVK